MTRQDRSILLPLMAAMFGMGTGYGLVVSGQPFVLEVSNPSLGRVMLRHKQILLLPAEPKGRSMKQVNPDYIA
jgi:hypothetical protein